MLKSKEIDTLDRITTTLGKETIFKGNMRFINSLKIDGTFQGKIESQGYLYIEQGALVEADIKVNSVIIGGTVKGNIEAKERVEMLATGKVYGNVKTAKLKIADGVVFEGKCEMIRDVEQIDAFSAPVSQLKASVLGAYS